MDPNAVEVPPISAYDVAVDIAPDGTVGSQQGNQRPGTAVDGSISAQQQQQQPAIRASVTSVATTSAHKKSRQQTPPLPVELIRPPPPSVISYRHRSEELIVDGKFEED